jgi:hypothetical protein
MLTEMQVYVNTTFIYYNKYSSGPTTGYIKIFSFNDYTEKCSVVFITLNV